MTVRVNSLIIFLTDTSQLLDEEAAQPTFSDEERDELANDPEANEDNEQAKVTDIVRVSCLTQYTDYQY